MKTVSAGLFTTRLLIIWPMLTRGISSSVCAPSCEKGLEIFSRISMTIDVQAYTVTVGSRPVELTARQVELLRCLAENAGRVLSREQLLNRVWGYDYYGDTRVVDTQIKRIRQKLPGEGVGFEIRTIYGVGYKLEEKACLSRQL